MVQNGDLDISLSLNIPQTSPLEIRPMNLYQSLPIHDLSLNISPITAHTRPSTASTNFHHIQPLPTLDPQLSLNLFPTVPQDHHRPFKSFSNHYLFPYLPTFDPHISLNICQTFHQENRPILTPSNHSLHQPLPIPDPCGQPRG